MVKKGVATMVESAIHMPQLAPDEFLGIFIVATLVLVFGVGYAALITLSKMGFVPKKWQPFGYLFWVLQAYSLYDLSVRIQSNPFTIKVLAVAMMIYFFAPHLYFYLIEESEKRYEPAEDGQPTK
jgi:type III secretory pathway component EscS